MTLNVYNLQRPQVAKDGSLKQPLNASFGFGFYHTGLEIFGKEWTFGGNPMADAHQSGIFPAAPKAVLPTCQFHKSVTLGLLPKSVQERDLLKVLTELEPQWKAVSYHLLSHNCNHFTEALREALIQTFHASLREIPSYVNRAARVADFVVPEPLYRSLMLQAPQSGSKTQSTTCPSPTDQRGTNEESIPSDPVFLKAKTVRQLRTLMWVHSIPMDGCLEKEDLIARILEWHAMHPPRR